ncbi:MAG: type I 3-dehydroquinate dehydratase [Ignisphaera sp.]|nr:type I 3-dehydroquinate dehydratase [Ignisphaera sp.]MCX8167574.1 type I 3-dehydroquinate dehydratase [Ignisphaera sp.]MDW8086177.1 type I 3-dehydroquinate dehydratase [Ignisphaera sp.]
MGKLSRPYVVASKPILKPQDIRLALSIDDADFIELRVDYMDRPLEVDYSILKGRRVIVTLREFDEGGAKPHDPNTKIELLEGLRSMGIMYDVEVSFIEKFGVDYTNAIVSMHFINSKPNTDYVVEKVLKYGDRAFIVKVVTVPFPGYKSFLVRLLEMGDNISAFPMSVDPLERVAFALLGSRLLYGYVDTPTAKGQLHYKQLKELIDVLSRYAE